MSRFPDLLLVFANPFLIPLRMYMTCNFFDLPIRRRLIIYHHVNDLTENRGDCLRSHWSMGKY